MLHQAGFVQAKELALEHGVILWAAPSFLEAPLKSTLEAQAVEVLKPQLQRPSQINLELLELVKRGTDEKQLRKLIEKGAA